MEPIVVNLMEPLKPCPFCGGEAKSTIELCGAIDHWVLATVHCPRCHIKISKSSNYFVESNNNDVTFLDMLQLMADVIYKWNNRNETNKDK